MPWYDVLGKNQLSVPVCGMCEWLSGSRAKHNRFNNFEQNFDAFSQYFIEFGIFSCLHLYLVYYTTAVPHIFEATTMHFHKHIAMHILSVFYLIRPP